MAQTNPISPVFLSDSCYAYELDGVLQTGPSLLAPEIHQIVTSTDVSATRVIVGGAITKLPKPARLSAGDTVARQAYLHDYLNKQVRFISTLWGWKGVTFSIRYVWNPSKERRIRVYWLCQAVSIGVQSAIVANRLYGTMADRLRELDVSIQPFANIDELQRARIPLPETCNLIEVRQSQQYVSCMLSPAYRLDLFQGPSTDWTSILTFMSSQEKGCFLSVSLQPTILLSLEQLDIETTQQNLIGISKVVQEYLTREPLVIEDPVAVQTARAYDSLRRRLVQPFVVSIQSGSADLVTAQGLAQSVVSDISFGAPSNEEHHVPIIIAPADQIAYAAAYATLNDFSIQPWGLGPESECKRRLPYLTDALGAASAFRLPVDMGKGLPGWQEDTGGIILGRSEDYGTPVEISLENLAGHLLIAGATGSGKSNTCQNLLIQFYRSGIPFLVIEPTNPQHRSLASVPNMGSNVRVFTLGDETVAPFRLNPLEISIGNSPEQHISTFIEILIATMPTFGALPSILESALIKVYVQRGWELSRKHANEDPYRVPKLSDLFFAVNAAITARRYTHSIESDLRGAAENRFLPFIQGSLGRMFNTEISTPFHQIMCFPTVLELDALSDRDKAFTMLLIMSRVRDYIRQRQGDGTIRHVTVIEEAHRIMARPVHGGNREVEGDATGKAAKTMSSMLSESRRPGECFVIVEQTPSRLVDDAINNTNTKIVHRLQGSDDIERLALAMNSDASDLGLASLAIGSAKVYHRGLDYPVSVVVEKQFQTDWVNDDRIREIYNVNHSDERAVLTPFAGCKHCRQICRFRDRVGSIAYDPTVRQAYEAAAKVFARQAKQGQVLHGLRILAKECAIALSEFGLDKSPDAVYCHFVHQSDPTIRSSAEMFDSAAADEFRKLVERDNDE